MTFDQWWDENYYSYISDECHMSSYHMAQVVWEAATQSAHESVTKSRRKNHNYWDGTKLQYLTNALHINDYQMAIYGMPPHSPWA